MEKEIRWFIKIWYDRETGERFNTISIQWDEALDGKWKWEGNKHVVKINDFTKREFFNQC